jgi:predicted RND superfamily exporter protein
LALIAALPLLYLGITRIEATVDAKNYFRDTTAIGEALEYIDQHFRGLGNYAVVITEPAQTQAQAVLPAIPGDSDTAPLTLRLGQDSLAALKNALACYRRFHTEPPAGLGCDWERFAVGHRHGRMTGSVLSIVDLVPDGTAIADPQKLLDALVQLADLDPTVNRMARLLTSDDGTATQILRLAHAESSLPIKQVNDRIMADLAGLCPSGPDAKCTAVFTGIGQVWNQFVQKLTAFLRKSFLTASFSILLIMMVFFYPRLDLGLLSFLPNVLPTLMILALVGFLGIPLDMSTAMVASIAMGLLVDDSMHMLHFFKEHLDRTGDFDGAVWHALHLSGRAVVTMSCVLAAGFSLLTWGDFLPVVRVGVLLLWIILAGLVFELIVTPSLLFGIYKPIWRWRTAL